MPCWLGCWAAGTEVKLEATPPEVREAIEKIRDIINVKVEGSVRGSPGLFIDLEVWAWERERWQGGSPGDQVSLGGSANWKTAP